MEYQTQIVMSALPLALFVSVFGYKFWPVYLCRTYTYKNDKF